MIIVIARLALQPAPGAAAGGDRRLAAGAVRGACTGRLARENAQRNPSRTAITAAALMIGLALVAFVTVFAAGAEELGRAGRRRKLRRRPGDPEQRRLLADPAGAATAARKVPGVELVATIRAAEAKLVDGGARRPRHGADPRHRRGRQDRMEAGRAGGAAEPAPTTRRSSPTPSPPPTASKSATASVCSARPANGRASRSPASSNPSSACFGSVLDHAAAMARRIRPDPGHDRLRRDRRRAPTPTTVQALLTKLVEVAFPTAEVLNQEELKENQEDAGRPARQPDLRAAGAGGGDLAVRDRQHAGALDPRAHPGARDAAGDRDVAAAGADDDPLRGGDHGADRGDPRDGPRRRLRGADRAAAEGRRLHALLSRSARWSCCWSSAALAGVLAAILPARRASRLDVLESLQYE